MKETMTPRQRMQTALNHKTPDRIPIDLGGFQTGIHQKAYRELIAHLGLQEEIVILDAVQQLAKPSEAVLERFHVDTRYICDQSTRQLQRRHCQKHPKRPSLARPEGRIRRRLVNARRPGIIYGHLAPPARRGNS